MRGLVAALRTAFICCVVGAALSSSAAASETETKEFTVGQWTGFSYIDDGTGQFHDCTAWVFNSDDIQLGVSVLKTRKLQLWLNSKAWNLPANHDYPVSFWIDRNQQYHGKVVVSSAKFAFIDVEQAQNVFDELQSGSEATFRTQNVDYVFDLAGSHPHGRGAVRVVH